MKEVCVKTRFTSLIDVDRDVSDIGPWFVAVRHEIAIIEVEPQSAIIEHPATCRIGNNPVCRKVHTIAVNTKPVKALAVERHLESLVALAVDHRGDNGIRAEGVSGAVHRDDQRAGIGVDLGLGVRR